ncbi:SEC14 [Nesidiocoris tenuis]|uniref:SEC14 n=1 Tax=Nesidiocoris tenuis TaxID=355587 RepID=A0ABN7AJA7_9HEMI|nr:SEC14 [Nesidiocoris tenuis]
MAEFAEVNSIYLGSRSSSSLSSAYGDAGLDGSPVHKIPSKEVALKTLRQLIVSNNNPDITCGTDDDEFLTRFLFARKMNAEEAYNLLANYFAYRKRNPELFENLTTRDPLVKQALYDGFPGVLPNKDRKGRTILVFFCNNWEDNNYPLEVVYRALILSLEKLLCEVHNQANGFVVIVDWTDISLRQVTSLANKTLKLMIEGLQDCFPARFKGIHFINQPWYIDPVITLLKAFLKEKTKKKIYVHGNNLSTLHEHIPMDVLPAELGGEGPPHSPTIWAHELTEGS